MELGIGLGDQILVESCRAKRVAWRVNGLGIENLAGLLSNRATQVVVVCSDARNIACVSRDDS